MLAEAYVQQGERYGYHSRQCLAALAAYKAHKDKHPTGWGIPSNKLPAYLEMGNRGGRSDGQKIPLLRPANPTYGRHIARDGMKKCGKCKEIKRADLHGPTEFSRNKARTDGFHRLCKPCAAIAAAEARERARRREMAQAA